MEYDETEEQNDEFIGQSVRNDSDEEHVGDNYRNNEDDDGYEDLEDKWYEIKDEFRDRYADLTDEDVDVKPGSFNKTMERIGRRRGKTRREIRNEIENW